MGDLLTERNTCSICGKEHAFCFMLDFSITDKFTTKEKEGKIGCYDCLRNGEFGFWHDTEFGFLDENGLRKVRGRNYDNTLEISANSLSELRRTPQIVTYQQEMWLTHCNDFMVYVGTWTPKDFNLNSPTGNGKDLFLELTDKELSHLWDESLQEGQMMLEEWYPTYYMFKCRHCDKLRGYWDCD